MQRVVRWFPVLAGRLSIRSAISCGGICAPGLNGRGEWICGGNCLVLTERLLAAKFLC